MALVTLCSGCGTTFRVTAAQLQAHGGDVRCGYCQRIFNGFATLITVNESAIENSSQLQLQLQSPPIDEPEIGSVEESRIIEDNLVAEENPVVIENLSNPPDSSDISNQGALAAETSQQQLLFDENEIRQQRSQALWLAANIFFLLMLIVQGIYIYRTELSAITPGTRSFIDQYCKIFGCTVPYSQDIKQLGIEASDLQKDSQRQPEVTTLSATIRNHAPFPQELPALQLNLLDDQDELVASRIFTAQDYLREKDSAQTFIESQQEIEIHVNFESSELDASGYHLRLLYP